MSTPKPESGVPSLYEWAGGMPAFERLTEIFYQRVKDDLVLAPLFARISPEHSSHVAQFIAEVFGGPKGYSARGGHPEMVRHHLGKLLTEPQRRRWAAMIVECADEANSARPSSPTSNGDRGWRSSIPRPGPRWTRTRPCRPGDGGSPAGRTGPHPDGGAVGPFLALWSRGIFLIQRTIGRIYS
jgi:truncated hemoglobin YjbI